MNYNTFIKIVNEVISSCVDDGGKFFYPTDEQLLLFLSEFDDLAERIGFIELVRIINDRCNDNKENLLNFLLYMINIEEK